MSSPLKPRQGPPPSGPPALGAPTTGAPNNGAPANGAGSNGVPTNGAATRHTAFDGESGNGGATRDTSNGSTSNGSNPNGSTQTGSPGNGAPFAPLSYDAGDSPTEYLQPVPHQHTPAEPPAGLSGSPFDDKLTVAIERPTHVSPADAHTRPWHRPGTGPIILPSHNVRHKWTKIFKRFLAKSWDDGLFGMSAEAAFWQALSTAPLLLALLGSIGYIGSWFGPDTINTVEERIVTVLRTVFSPEVAGSLIEPTVDSILHRGQADVVSVGFVIALWAGSSAIASFVESITIAYNQHEVRHPVTERFFALGLYLLALIFGIFALPLLAVGPEYLPEFFPEAWFDQVTKIVNIAYYPGIGLLLVVALTTLYKVAPHHKHPWRRGIPGAILAATVFIVSSFGLRIYITYVTTHGLTYGALATPIAFLLFAYFVGIAIILGAQFNNATLEYYPPKRSKRERRKWQRLEAQAADPQANRDPASIAGGPDTPDFRPGFPGQSDARADDSERTHVIGLEKPRH